MERRLAVTYSVTAVTTLGVACLTIATISGGLFASAAAGLSGGKRIELVDDYIVLHSSTTSSTPVVEAPTPTTGPAPAAAPSTKSPVTTVAGPHSADQLAVQPQVAPAATPTTQVVIVQPPASPESSVAAAPTPTATSTPAPTVQPPPPSTPVPPPATTVPQVATSTTAAPTSSTLPRGARIPSDWPPGKPIPPIPPGCRQPVLEDNGVWNCDD